MLLVIAATSLAACATSGHAWVQEPEPGWSAAGNERGYADALAVASPNEASLVTPDPAFAPRPRLARVVSLGESSTAREPSAAAALAAPSAAPAAPTVVVNIVNHAGRGYAPGAVYTSAAPLYRSHRVAAPTVTRPSPATPPAKPPLGGDWRTPASYGPMFPYHSAPASSWERGR